MDVIQSLGLDYTIAYQFIIFLIAYVFLSQFLFKPYLKAFESREEQTLGKEDLAEKMDLKTEDLENKLKQKQKELNTKIQDIFNAEKAAASSDAKEILDRARTESENNLAQANQKINKDIQKVKSSFSIEVPKISQTIVEKLVGRNI